MAISLSAKRSLRKSLKNNKENVLFKTKIKLTIKQFLGKPTTDGLKSVYSILDKSAKKGIFHKNKTARLKSSLAKKVKPKKIATPKSKSTKTV